MAKLYWMDKDKDFDLSLSPIPFEICDFDMNKIDVIHTASNPSFSMGGGWDKYLKDNFNCSFAKELELKDKIVSIVSVNNDLSTNKDIITIAYRKYFNFCKENGLKNIGLVGLGCGIGGLSKQDTVNCLIEAINIEFCIGYKCFNSHFKCRDIQFEVGETYHQPDDIIICKNGFHFCKNILNVFNYYDFDTNNIVCEVTGHGNFDFESDKVCFEYINIQKKLDWYDILHLSNTGNWNTGDLNTGNRNTGDLNTGDLNTGNRNTGDSNTGNWNTGDSNTGDLNTGYWNTGNRNTGDRNTGNRNTGNWNTGDSNTGDLNTGYWNTGNWNTGNNISGFMCTKEHLYIFNKKTNIPRNEIKFPNFLYFTIKDGKYKESVIESFGKCDKKDIDLLLKLPNFNYKIFEEIFGITKKMINNRKNLLNKE